MSEDANVSAAESLVEASQGLLTLAGGSAALISIIASDQIAQAASRVDQSLAQHWSQTNQDNVEEGNSPYPRVGTDWAQHKDAISFRAAKVVADWRGVTVAEERVPAVRIVPEYLPSYFSVGDRYMDTARVLTKPLGVENDDSLRDMLRVGLGGLNTVAARQISSPESMQQFCTDLKQLLSRFLTESDELVARFAILELETPYFASDALRNPQCLSDGETAMLADLNGRFEVPGIGRESDAARHEAVQARMLPLTAALRNQDREAFEALLAERETFALQVIHPDAFPRPGQALSATGVDAIDQVLSLGLRSGCYQAPPGQSLAALPAVALLPNLESTGLLARFDEAGGLKALIFAAPAFITDITGVTGWPNSNDCDLV